MEKIEFKDILKDILEDLKISQQEFAKKLGTTQGTVSKWLNGVQEPRFCQLQNIALVYNIDASTLLGIY